MYGWNTMLICILAAIPLAMIIFEIVERWDEIVEWLKALEG